MPSVGDVVVSVRNVRKAIWYPSGESTDVLSGLSLTLSSGSVVAVEGPSGSGKTTLLRILGLLERPDHGEYEILGQNVLGMNDRALSRLRGTYFGFIFQDFCLFDGRTALQNVMAPLEHASWREFRARKRRALELLALVGLERRAWGTSHTLSGGEQQRVAIARALVRGPAIILADEPTGSLDSKTGYDVMNLFLKLARDSRRTVLMVTHDQRLASLADRQYHIRDGALLSGPELS